MWKEIRTSLYVNIDQGDYRMIVKTMQNVSFCSKYLELMTHSENNACLREREGENNRNVTYQIENYEIYK